MGRPKQGIYRIGSASLEVRHNGSVTTYVVNGQEFTFNETGDEMHGSAPRAEPEDAEEEADVKTPRFKIPQPPKWPR